MMLIGKAPFQSKEGNIRGTFNAVTTGIYEVPDYVPHQARDLLSRMLVKVAIDVYFCFLLQLLSSLTLVAPSE
jgi:hypothetical protein